MREDLNHQKEQRDASGVQIRGTNIPPLGMKTAEIVDLDWETDSESEPEAYPGERYRPNATCTEVTIEPPELSKL